MRMDFDGSMRRCCKHRWSCPLLLAMPAEGIARIVHPPRPMPGQGGAGDAFPHSVEHPLPHSGRRRGCCGGLSAMTPAPVGVAWRGRRPRPALLPSRAAGGAARALGDTGGTGGPAPPRGSTTHRPSFVATACVASAPSLGRLEASPHRVKPCGAHRTGFPLIVS